MRCVALGCGLFCRIPKDSDNRPSHLKQGVMCFAVIASRVTLYNCAAETNTEQVRTGQ